jgi:large subunit ribosomal protein L13
MNNVTYSAKKSEVERKWYIIDATDKPLGRVATEAARLLRGKHKPTFTPNIDTGDNVIIINCKDAKLTGNKMNSQTSFRIYWRNERNSSCCNDGKKSRKSYDVSC